MLSYLVPNMSKPYVRKFFNYFLHSKYLSDVSAALKFSNIVWNSSSGKIFVNKYLETGNENFLTAVLDNKDYDSILDNLEGILLSEGLHNYLKNKIIRSVSQKNFQKLSFLKDAEPDKFLYACAFSEVKLEDTELKSIFSKLEPYQIPFGLWCVGKMHNWQFLKKEIDNYI